MKKPRAVHRRAQLFTILLVGEGHAEEALLRHLKALYAPRGSGVAVTIRNARGKGAAHVVDYAIGQTRNAAYDYKLALLDADTDWTERVKKCAAEENIEVIACDPCLEVLLLSAYGPVRVGYTSVQAKRQFRDRFGVSADEPRVYAEHFALERLEESRKHTTDLDRLLRAFSVRTP